MNEVRRERSNERKKERKNESKSMYESEVNKSAVIFLTIRLYTPTINYYALSGFVALYFVMFEPYLCHVVIFFFHQICPQKIYDDARFTV